MWSAVVSNSQATSKNLNSPPNRRERSPERRLTVGKESTFAREFVGTYGAAGLVPGLASGAAAAGLSAAAGLASEAAEADASGAGAVSSDLRHPAAVRNIATRARSRTLGIASSLVPRCSRYSAKTQKGQLHPVFIPECFRQNSGKLARNLCVRRLASGAGGLEPPVSREETYDGKRRGCWRTFARSFCQHPRENEFVFGSVGVPSSTLDSGVARMRLGREAWFAK